jgi:glycosyltransferase involved in cell wall biosynthesis
VAPVGAHPAWFDAGLEGANREVDWPLRVVFFGLYTPLQGAITIGRALARLTAADNVEVLMIGGGQQLAAAREAAGESSFVHWVDWVAPEALPATVASQDVALGIFGDGPKAMRVVPNKVYQSAAAGCAVVTSDSVPQRRALGEEAIFVPPADDEALAAVLRHLGRNAALVGKYRSAARGRASQFFGPAAVTAGLAAQLERHS